MWDQDLQLIQLRNPFFFFWVEIYMLFAHNRMPSDIYFQWKFQSLPGWWRWYYWANPISWTLYGLIASQFGDLDQPMLLSDGVSSTTIKIFLEDHYGFHHEFLGVVAIMVVGFSVIFAVVFAFAIKNLNFQRR